MDFWIYYFFSALWLLIGLVAGYRWHAWDAAHCQAEEPVTTTQGAAYDACLDEPTEYDAEAVRKMLNF